MSVARPTRRLLRQALRLHANADAHEIDAILDSYFRSSVASRPTQKRYPSEGPRALTVVWDHALERIVSLIPGPALTSADVEVLAERAQQAAVVTHANNKVAAMCMRIRGEVEGAWRYRDLLQLFTAPLDGELEVPEEFADRAVVLQVRYSACGISDEIGRAHV